MGDPLTLSGERFFARCPVEDKVWATGPDGEEWEYYTVLADSEQFSSEENASTAACCASGADEAEPAATCC